MKTICVVISPWSLDIYTEKQKGMKDTSEYRLLQGMINAGFEVHLIIPDKYGGEDPIDYDGISIHKYKLFQMPPIRNKLLNNVFKKSDFLILTILSTIKTLKISHNLCVDLYYGFTSSGSIAAFLVGMVRGVPNVSRIFGTFLYPVINSKFQLLLRFDELLGFIIPCQYLIITNDGTKGDAVAKILGVPEEKIKFWMNGSDDFYNPNYDHEKFRRTLDINQNSAIILWVSRLDTWKRVDRLINSIPFVVEKKNEVIFLIVGDGPQKKDLENLSETLGIMKYVRFLGALPHKEVQWIMNGADIFVSLYDLSNVGSPLLEAMRCGRCIVTLNNGDTKSIISHNKNGILMDQCEPAKLAEVIINLMDDDVSRNFLGQNAISYAKEHFITWNERIQMEMELLKKIISKP